MGLNVGESAAVNDIINHLAGRPRSYGGAPVARACAIDAAALLADAANKRLGAGLDANRARALLEQWTDTRAETWTAPDGPTYDLTIGYRDATGDAWTPVGWLTPFDGAPVPYLECNGMSADIETVIREFGPLVNDTRSYQ